jgi:hypothetical protein
LWKQVLTSSLSSVGNEIVENCPFCETPAAKRRKNTAHGASRG